MVVLFSSFPIFLMEYLLSQAKSNMGYVLKLIEHYQCALCLHNEWRNSEVACLVSHQEFCYRCQGEAALERWAPLLWNTDQLCCKWAGNANESLCPECSWPSLPHMPQKAQSVYPPGLTICLRRKGWRLAFVKGCFRRLFWTLGWIPLAAHQSKI